MFDIVNSALSANGIRLAIKIIFWLVIFIIAIKETSTSKKRGER